MLVDLGDPVERGEVVASISDAFGSRPTHVRSTDDGWVIAQSLRPMVNSGDSLVHIAAETGPDRDEPAEKAKKR
jgi:predicted deacylase